MMTLDKKSVKKFWRISILLKTAISGCRAVFKMKLVTLFPEQKGGRIFYMGRNKKRTVAVVAFEKYLKQVPPTVVIGLIAGMPPPCAIPSRMRR